METTKMTLHRALAELKILDSRISKAMDSLNPVAIKQNDKLVNLAVDEQEFSEKAKASFQSVKDLMDRKIKIKKALVLKNAQTTFKVADQTMTIADAISLKNMMNLKKDFLESLKEKHKKSMAQLNRGNEMVNNNLQALLLSSLGKESSKQDENSVKAISEPFLKLNKLTLCDPLKIEKEMENMQNEIDAFETEVDAALSEINATTFIEIN